MARTVLELSRDHFFPRLFANDLLEIRRVNATSFRFAAFLWHNTYGERTEDRSAWSNRQWQNHLANPMKEFYVIYCDGEPAGCCEISRPRRVIQLRGGAARIESLGLLPEFQGEDLGADGLTRMVETAFATGASRVRINSNADIAPRVIKMLEGQGFRRISQN